MIKSEDCYRNFEDIDGDEGSSLKRELAGKTVEDKQIADKLTRELLEAGGKEILESFEK